MKNNSPGIFIGQSQYFQNGTRCRRRDITDIFPSWHPVGSVFTGTQVGVVCTTPSPTPVLGSSDLNNISIIVIVIFCFLTLSIASCMQPGGPKNGNDKVPQEHIIIWNMTTSGDLESESRWFTDIKDVVGYADGAGTITLFADFYVPNDWTLIIEEGVSIVFQNELSITVQGTLKINGTQNAVIT